MNTDRKKGQQEKYHFTSNQVSQQQQREKLIEERKINRSRTKPFKKQQQN